jgi:mannan endo-1,4-beta-mannosidase
MFKNNFFKTFLYISIWGFSLQPLLSHANDKYNHLNNQLTIASVVVGDLIYKDVIITIKEIINIGNQNINIKDINSYDSYDSKTGFLTIPSVTAYGNTYFNVVIAVGNIISIGGSTNALPISKISAPQYTGTGASSLIDASNSFDYNNISLSYKWSYISKPAESKLNNNFKNDKIIDFTPDVSGLYKLQLIVNNGKFDSLPVTFSINSLPFIKTKGSEFVSDNKIFKFAGNNSQWITHVDASYIEKTLVELKNLNMNVIRIWAYNEIGSLDNSVPSIEINANGKQIYFQYWDKVNKKQQFNEAGLVLLDTLLSEANKNGFRVIMTLSNNWVTGGGIDQYNIWHNSKFHDDFFDKPEIISSFKNYISTLVNRKNTITGTVYKNDPAIFSWELSNELFCFTDSYPWRSTKFSRSTNCNAQKIATWADNISTFIRSIDSNHLISLGNIGFINRGLKDEYSNVAGDDFELTLNLKNINFGTFHLYIDNPDRPYDINWGIKWINDHISIAKGIGKPVVMEEFGHAVKETRDKVLDSFLNVFHSSGGNGWLVWNIPLILPSGIPLGGATDFDIDKDSSTAAILKSYASKFIN